MEKKASLFEFNLYILLLGVLHIATNYVSTNYFSMAIVLLASLSWIIISIILFFISKRRKVVTIPYFILNAVMTGIAYSMIYIDEFVTVNIFYSLAIWIVFALGNYFMLDKLTYSKTFNKVMHVCLWVVVLIASIIIWIQINRAAGSLLLVISIFMIISNIIWYLGKKESIFTLLNVLSISSFLGVFIIVFIVASEGEGANMLEIPGDAVIGNDETKKEE